MTLHPIADSIRHLEAIAEALRLMSDQFETVTVEYPGCIQVQTEEGPVWVIGTANGPFGADYYEWKQDMIDGNPPARSVESDIPTDSQPADIASAIFALMSSDTEASTDGQ
jgi:hypothetical protein